MNLTQRQQESAIGSASSLEERGEIDLGELLRALWRGKLWIALCSFFTILLGAYYAFVVAVPVFTTSAVVALESRQEQVVDIESVVTGLSGDQATINTEVEVMRSRGLLYKLVDRLELLEDPEFNPTLRPTPKYSLRKAIHYTQELIKGPAPEAPPMSDQAVLDRTVDELLKGISASNVRQSYVFRITAVTESPPKSAAIANTLAELYIREQLDVKFAATEEATVWLADRVTQLQIELETAESELKAFGTSSVLVSPEALTALNRQLKELRERSRDVEAQIGASKAQRDAVAAARKAEDLLAIATASGDTTLQGLVVGALEGDARVVRSFETRLEQIMTRSEIAQRRTQAQLVALISSVAQVEQQIADQSGELVELQQLQRETEASRLIYEYFLGRLKETSVQAGIQQADSRILSRAVIPTRPSAPRKSIILVMSMMLGLVAGAVLVLAREFSQNTFRVAEALENRTGYSVLGQIPMVPARRRKKVLQYLSEKPNSAAAEAIRNLRTSTLLSNLDSHPQVIMSTSSVPGEGKTTVSLALTQNLAGLDKKVLLIEGDIRRRTFAQYFNVEESKGLLSVLSDEVKLADAVEHVESLGADVLFGEKSKTNAADVFSSARFAKFLKDMRKVYDYIVIDTPPVLAVPDARVIGQAADAILYSVKWDSTTHRQVVDGLKAFESVNVKVSGLVLGQISPKGLKRYGYGDSYGAYSDYYDS